MLRERGDPWWHRGAARAQLDKRTLQRIEQLVDVEEALYLLLAQEEQWLAPNLGEADHGYDCVVGHFAVVELPEEAGHLLDPADLGVVVLDLAR